MPIYAKSETQVRKVMSVLSPHIKSVGTNRNYAQALKNFCDYLKSTVGKTADLRAATIEQAQAYLQTRAAEVSQKTLDMDRQAIQKMMQVVGTLPPDEKLKDPETGKIEKSEIKTELKPRSYTNEQVAAICDHQTEKYALSTQIAHAAGLRAHELFTIERADEKAATYRPNKQNERLYGQYKFEGREKYVSYVVTGKGGHVREIRLPRELADKLERRRFDEPHQVRDRRVIYYSKYDIAGGQKWSNSFSKASTKTLGWSNGAHGLRHSYAQDRMSELETRGHTHSESEAIVSLEMGHYRETITEVYLR